MRKLKVMAAFLLAAALLLGGCSAYYRSDTESAAAGPDIQIETEETKGEDEGPGIHSFNPDDMTIESLELPEKEDDGIRNPEIIIATDIHYLAKELTDFGEAFEQMEKSEDGKVISYVWEITDAFLDAVVAKNPQVLILSGDLSLNGELYSHEALAQKLERVEREGIDVVVIPGNHDINNPRAAAFQGSTKVPTETTSREQFRSIYGEFGYDEALSNDPSSLSYIYELPDGTWLFMLDSCQYESPFTVGGMIRTETYEWMEEWLETAYNDNHNVIAVAHHNLLDESRIYEKNCTIEHAERLEELLADWGVTLFLSGHLHVQHYREAEYTGIEEIVTSALSISPCQYGVLKYFDPETFDYHTETVDVTSWADREGNPDVNLQNFASYADSFLQESYYESAYSNLQNKELTEEERQTMAEYYALLNVYAVAGRAEELMTWALSAPARELWQEYNRTDIQSMYLDEIVEDAVCDYNTFQR